MKHKTNFKKVILFSIAISFLLSLIISIANASSTTYEINNFEDLLKYAEQSRTAGHEKDNYILTKDIIITEAQQAELEKRDVKHISFGSSDYPFAGKFNGQNHTITNLSYKSTLAPKTDTGLFAYTGEGAIISNLTIENADIASDYRGGAIAGYAKGTTFENVTVKNSNVFIDATDNVLTLITDGGVRGAALIGEAENCVIYNCEVDNTKVETKNTSAIAALSGKGLYLGGLVGTCNNTEIEYSRVIGGNITNYYDVAIGALGGNTLYVGGIAGQMKNSSKIIDCFATNDLYYYCATYVSVGAGNSGHIGGITGAMFGDKNEIQRSHFAGTTSSKQYNAVLVIPIIQSNPNISGITDVFEGGAVANTYFKSSRNPDVKMNVLGSATETSLYGSQSDERYNDKNFWTEQNYDFSGTISRSSNYSDAHYNKWVMDYDLGIPIHGNSIAATFDFEGAGQVEIDKTNLVNKAVKTTTPYNFAVQGITTSENKINVTAKENEGYRFCKWYKVPNIIASSLTKNHDFFSEIFSKYTTISEKKELQEIDCQNNDLFVAYYQTQVLFHDIQGNVVNKTTGEKEEIVDNSDDWYDYNAELPDVSPVNKPNSSSANLIGWTTQKSTEQGGGYSSISIDKLQELKENKSFYQTGTKVTKTLSLYPIYADLISNIVTVFEGNEKDSSSNVSLRTNVGYTSATMADNGNAIIEVVGEGTEGAFPEGYRFLGWYEGNSFVSDETRHELKGVDLTKRHTYEARFEYRVDYYVKRVFNTESGIYNEGKLFKQIWQKYNTPFEKIKGVDFYREIFTHWGLEEYQNVNEYTGNITQPTVVYSYNRRDDSSDTEHTNYTVDLTTDFPGSAYIKQNNEMHKLSGSIEYDNTLYNLIMWSLERVGTAGEGVHFEPEYGTNPTFNHGIMGTDSHYTLMAHLTANVTFHQKDGTYETITRRYEEPIISNGSEYTYKLVMKDSDTNYKNTSVASPSAKQYDGYYFAGWVNLDYLTKEEQKDLYDVKWVDLTALTESEIATLCTQEKELFCTTSIEKANHYKIKEDTLTYEAMPNIFPIYAKYDIKTTTNVAESGVKTGVNIPSNPSYILEESESNDGTGKITLTADKNTYVTGSSGEKYNFISIERIYDNGTKEELVANNNGKYEYDVKAGLTYSFIANYEPLLLVYHLNDVDTKVEIRKNGDQVGKQPQPTYDISNILDNGGNRYLCIGWSNDNPSNNKYHKFNDYSSYQNSNISIIATNMLVKKSMELWPVYVPVQVNVKSNIDNYLQTKGITPTTVRNFKRIDSNTISLNVDNNRIDSYEFIGWYKDYTNLTNPGKNVSENKQYILKNNEAFLNVTYTAVFREVYDINYYDTKGNIIYTAHSYQGEPRSFVTTVIESDGKEHKTPIDYKAFYTMQKSLKHNEMFKTWQWIQESGNIQQWNEFCETAVVQNMNLYPITNKITAKDNINNEIDLVGNSEDKEPDILVGFDSDEFFAEFNIAYTKPSLTMHMEEVEYKANGEKNIVDLNNAKITLYADNTKERKILGTKNADVGGNAVFEFMGNLKITKELISGKENDIFVFNISSQEQPNAILNKVSLKPGESINVKLPYGEYIVTEDSKWAWRYNSSAEGNSVVSNYGDGNITFKNQSTISKWFDGITKKENKY